MQGKAVSSQNGTSGVAASSATTQSDDAASSASLTKPNSLGHVHYRPAPDAEFKTGVVSKTKLSNGTVSTRLIYEGVEYPNAKEWLSIVFNNSGRACYHIIPKSVVAMGDTPRAKVYLPPNERCRFGRYV